MFQESVDKQSLYVEGRNMNNRQSADKRNTPCEKQGESKMEITCSNCGQTCEVDEEPATGRHLLCPFCDVEFKYTPQNTTENDSNSIANTAEPNAEMPPAKIQAICPHCGATYEVDAAYIGETATCGTCDNPFVIKASQETQSPDAPADAAAEKAAQAQTTPGATNGHIAATLGKKKRIKTIRTKDKMSVNAAKDKTIALCRSSRKGKVSICAIGTMAVLLVGFWMFKERDTSLIQSGEGLNYAPSQPGERDNKSVVNSNTERCKETKSNNTSRHRFAQLFNLAEEAAADGRHSIFYGFFPGMSRHDAQLLAEAYDLDGNECYIHADGEKSVCKIFLRINAIVHILREHNINAQTYNEVAQAVANAVGDLQGKGTRTINGDTWGGRTYYNEHIDQWYERNLVNGAGLKLTKEGMLVWGAQDIRSKMPLETSQSKQQRLAAEKTVITSILGNMVDIPVKGGMEPFKMGKYEVTQLEWMHVMGKNPSNYMSEQIGSRNRGIRPVEEVSLDDCNEFIDALNKLPEVKQSGLLFRLPTAEEWVHACRAGASTGISKLADGREISSGNVDEIAWFGLYETTKSVGLKSPNAFGLHDMLGNVAEWTLSWDEEYKDRAVCIGGDSNNRYEDKNAENYWRESERAKTKSSRIGLRLCASKNTGTASVKGRRSFDNSSMIDGITWKYDVIDGEATITGASPKTREIKIPAAIGEKHHPVKAIGKSAFSDWHELASVAIPDSVMKIESRAFDQCRGLTSLVLPKSLVSIGENAFYNCCNLKELSIPDSVKSLGEGAFYSCDGLIKLQMGNSVTNIPENAFLGCSGITDISIPDSVVSFDSCAFSGCSALTSITIGNGVREIGSGAFEGLDNLKNVTIGNSATNIGMKAFYNCRNLASLTIGNSVTSIGPAAFELCEKLKTVKLPDSLTIIGNGAFESCERLKEIKIPDSVVNIGAGAFSDCTGLTSLDLGRSVKYIGTSAFDGCEGLRAVKIPGSVKRIGERAFKQSGLASVTIGRGVEDIGPWAFWGCSELTNVTIPDSVTTIGELAFNQCGLTSVSIGTKVKSIGDGAFSWCHNLKSVTIPPSVESIGEEAFECCVSLESVTISNPATDIGDRAFEDCRNLKNIRAPKTLLPLKTE